MITNLVRSAHNCACFSPATFSDGIQKEIDDEANTNSTEESKKEERHKEIHTDAVILISVHKI